MLEVIPVFCIKRFDNPVNVDIWEGILPLRVGLLYIDRLFNPVRADIWEGMLPEN